MKTGLHYSDMKTRFYILILIFISSSVSVFACDICGCSTGNYFIGPIPQFNKHFVGVRYTSRSLNTILNADRNQFSKDFYQTAEWLGGWKLKEKWQLFIFVPYNINHSVTDDGDKNNNGFGDITVISNYSLLDKFTISKDSSIINQKIWIGSGMKLPSGKFSVDENELISSANNQPGTGSIDFLLNAIYSLTVKNWGINCNVNYKFNQSADDYKFGNRFNASTFVFRSIHFSKVIISPNIGLLFENLNSNKIHNQTIEDTGGSTFLSAFGIETHFKKIAVGGNIQFPIAENLSGKQTTTIIKGMLHLSYMF